MRTHVRTFITYVLVYGVLSALLFVGALAIFFSFLPTQEPLVTNDAQIQSPPLSTNVWCVFDPKTGEVIAGSSLDEVHPIASITKLFTAEAVLMSNRKDDVFTVTSTDVETEGRAGKLAYGEKVTPYKLLFPLLLESSNDAAHAIERYLGPEYKNTVLSLTESLALQETTISDSSGLSSLNVSTPRELALYYAHIKQSHPHILDITQLRMFVEEDEGYINNDPARSFDAFSGGKHGFTDEANRTFVGTFVDSDNDSEFGVVLLGSADLKGDIKALLTYGENITDSSDIMAK